MASETEKTVVYAYLRGQLDAAHDAIVAVWAALQGINHGTLVGEDLDETIYAALRVLPAEKRTAEMGAVGAALKQKKTEVRSASDFDDILGG